MAYSVMIIEDVEEMRLLLEQIISEEKEFKVSGSVENGVEARLEITRRRPDLVLLDEVLPGEATLDLLQDFAQDGIRVVLITGLSEPSPIVPPEALGRIRKPDWKSFEADRKRICEFLLKKLKMEQSTT